MNPSNTQKPSPGRGVVLNGMKMSDEWRRMTVKYQMGKRAAERAGIDKEMIKSDSKRFRTATSIEQIKKVSGVPVVEVKAAKQEKTVDLILFAGQSNMAGRGKVNHRWTQRPPKVIDGAGWEFRAVSDSTRLYPIEEPFGVNENTATGICDTYGGQMDGIRAKSGIPVVAVCASKGGSSIAQWQPNSAFLDDALNRLSAARTWLAENRYTVRHVFCAWCQGETDGDSGTSAESYTAMFDAMLAQMQETGVEQLLMIRIGRCNDESDLGRYDAMITLQDELAASREAVSMVSTSFADMRERGLMLDEYHDYQQAYNEVGTEAGRNAALTTEQNTKTPECTKYA